LPQAKYKKKKKKKAKWLRLYVSRLRPLGAHNLTLRYPDTCVRITDCTITGFGPRQEMSLLDIPDHWILEYALRHPTQFTGDFIQRISSEHTDHPMPVLIRVLTAGLIDDIALKEQQPLLTAPVIIALLRRIFSSPESVRACSPDMNIHETLDYLETLDKHRAKRVKALERRGGLEAQKYLKLSRNAPDRYKYIVNGLKLWVRNSPRAARGCRVLIVWVDCVQRNQTGALYLSKCHPDNQVPIRR